MKKFLFFVVTMLVSVSVFAQTKATFITEHFDGTSMPSGWQVMGMGTQCWSISATQNAGGSANELKLYYNPQFNGTSRMVMPAVDLTGVSSVVVSFKHALDNYSGSHVLGVATSSDNGTTWNVGWQQNYGSNGQWNVSQQIVTPDMGNSSVRFCIFYTGNSYNINNWYFDDIEIFSQENLDVQLSSIDMNTVTDHGSKDVIVTVFNKGLTAVNELTLSYQIDDNPAVVETFSTNLNSLASTQLTFAEPVSFIPGSYNVTVNIDAVNGGNDDDSSNNTAEKTINVTLGATQRIPMIEHFSSSTCGPCVSVNTQMLNLTNNNPGKFTYTKYQMNWPGSGDPYYTAEGGTRRQYYGVNAVPMVFLDGQEKSVNQTVLDNAYNTPAFTDVRGSFNVSGNTITVKVDFMSYYNLNTAKVFVTVNEKLTTGNVGSNGETSFHHVFMKFLTSANGDAMDIAAGGYQHFEFTQDLSGTHVEEMSDLEVSAWMQDYGTKEMLNSHFMYEYTDEHPYPVDNLAISDANDNKLISWEAHEGSNPIGYNVFVNGNLVAENITETSVTHSAVPDELFIAEVQALYADDKSSVKMAVMSQDGPAPQNELSLSVSEIVFNEFEENAVLTITNNTEANVTINDIAENPETEYLGIELGAGVSLPFDLEPGSSIEVLVSPKVYAKSPVTTNIVIESTLGTQTVDVTVNSSWYDGIVESNSVCEIYPNPTTGSFTVKGNDLAKVEVYNLVGQKVFEQEGSMVNINASNWNKGVYMVNMTNQNGSVETQKLMVK